MTQTDNDVLKALVKASEGESPELDSLVEVPEVITDEDGKRLLALCESYVGEGWTKYKEGKQQLHLAVHVILENGLWRYALDDAGNKFSKQEDYLRHLADRLKVSRSTIFQNRSALKLASGGLGFELNEIDAIGMTPFAVARSMVEIDRDTGEVLNIPGAELPEDVSLGEKVREAVLQVAPIGHDLDLKPVDVRRAIKEALNITTPEVMFFANSLGRNAYEVGFAYNGTDRRVLFTMDSDVPSAVREKMFRNLKITI